MNVYVDDKVPLEFFTRILTEGGLRVTANKGHLMVRMPPKWAPAKWPVCSMCDAPAPFHNGTALFCPEHYPR